MTAVRLRMKQGEAKYRRDIDGLRALAVCAVIGYHYLPGRFPGGFIGVDIFFVISGYLITGILLRDFDASSCNLSEFYQRRIRRIFPALILILAFCLVLGWIYLFPFEYASLGRHIAAGAGFVQNIMLWREAGYFDITAIQKPLLHLWSLAVEEQFYVFWPLLLWVILSRSWSAPVVIAIVAGGSFSLNVWTIWNGQTESAFYSPLSRVWELMAGAWLAVRHGAKPGRLVAGGNLFSWAGLGMIGAGLWMIRPEHDFPGFWALLPVMGAMFLIHGGPEAFVNNKVLSLRLAVWIGLISYPLYLWHWVLLSWPFLILGALEPKDTRIIRVTAIALSFVFAWMTYKWFEWPIRHRGRFRTTAILVIIVAGLGVAGLTVHGTAGMEGRSSIPDRADAFFSRPNIDRRTDKCRNLDIGKSLRETWYCEVGDALAERWIFVYGDSHALSLVPVLDLYGKSNDVRIVFSYRTACIPLLGVSVLASTGPACAELAERAARKASDEKASAVVLVLRWTFYVGGTTRPNEVREIRINSTRADEISRETPKGLGALKHGLSSTLLYYETAGIPVILIQDNPQQSDRLPLSTLRNTTSEEALNRTAISFLEHKRNQAEVNDVIERMVSAYPNGSALSFDGQLCGDDICPWVLDGKFLYVDDDHLSVAGAMRIYPLLARHLESIMEISDGRGE